MKRKTQRLLRSLAVLVVAVTLSHVTGMPVEAATNETRIYREFAGRYQGALQKTIVRSLPGGAVKEFFPLLRTKLRMPPGKGKMKGKANAPAGKVPFATNLKKPKIQKGGNKLRLKGRAGFDLRPIGDPGVLKGGFRGTVTRRGSKNHLKGKYDLSDPNFFGAGSGQAVTSKLSAKG